MDYATTISLIELEVLKARTILGDILKYFNSPDFEPTKENLTAVSVEYQRIAARLLAVEDMIDGIQLLITNNENDGRSED